MENSDRPDIEPLTRPQVLIAMAATALLLLTVAKVWQYLGSISLLSVQFSVRAFLLGIGLALAMTLASGLLYRLWAAYRRSADYYLELVLKPLVLPDYVWLGLLPGMSEELLFRGVMLPALGGNALAVVLSSVLFGSLHLSGTKQWPYAIWATAIGLILGFSALLTGNLLVPIVAHVLTNFFSGCLWRLNNKAARAEGGVD